MREIKFRAWDNVKDKMYYVGEDNDIVFYFNSAGIVAQDTTEEEDEFKYLLHLKYMQYTGLVDKNGVEIFEGDIVITSHPIYDGEQLNVNTVDFFDFCWRLTPVKKPVVSQIPIARYAGHIETIEIIGNIYENADLLPKAIESNE